MKTSTLSGRLFRILSLWTVIAITLIGVLISSDYRISAEQRFEKILTANVYALMGAVRLGDDGKLTGTPDLGEPRYQQFGSGWYWSIQSTVNPDNKVSSLYLSTQTLPAPVSSEFNDEFQRQFSIMGSSGRELMVQEAQVILGEGNEIFSFKIAGNKSEIDAEVSNFVARLVVILGLFGFSLVLASYFLVRFGLRPLANATKALEDIREGRSERIEGVFPSEVQPLIDETNALLVSNKSVIERARTQVGNLAHSLKTPMAVIRNELGGKRTKSAGLLLEQIGQMQDQIQIYLDRARISARHATVTSKTDIELVTGNLVRVIGKLNPNLDIIFENEKEASLFFAGEESDFQEVIGNLLENASKFASEKIQISTVRQGKNSVAIFIEDDGPGLSSKEAKVVMARGKRLDESKPGSGLGLSIVKEILNEYQGKMQLSKSSLGGLKVELTLPLVAVK